MVVVETDEDGQERLHRIIQDTRGGALPLSTSDFRWLVRRAAAGIVLLEELPPNSRDRILEEG